MGLHKFIGLITLTNRDFPYHDFVSYDDGDEPVSYRVGHNNVQAHGDQSKYFVSKRTLVYSDATGYIRFNHSDNVQITIHGEHWYEFHNNVTRVFVDTIGAEASLDLIFEGVLPDEARDAE